jgi:hypothetical protein
MNVGAHCRIAVVAVLIGGALSISLAGCGSTATRAAENAALPFSVRLKEVRLKPSPEKPEKPAAEGSDQTVAAKPEAEATAEAEAKKGPVAPAMFDKTWEVTHELTRVLEEANVFTRIVAADDKKTPVDLELEIEADGTDFGAGDPTVLGSLSSTVVWLLVGHLSWFIDNREYQDSNVSLRLSIRPVPARPVETGTSVSEAAFPRGGEAPAVSPSAPLASAAEPKEAKQAGTKKRPSAKAKTAPAAPVRAAARPPDAVFQDALRLTGLRLNFIERAGVANWFINIFIPPFVGDGVPETAGQSLTHRGIEHFGETEKERLVFSFPASYFRSTSRYLVPEPGKESVDIVSQGPIDAIAIRAEGRAERRIDDPDVVPLLAVEGAAKEELRLSIAERVIGVAGGSGGVSATGERYYRVPLEPGEVGYVQVEVSPSIGNVLSQWTIYRKPAAGAAGEK